MSHPRRDDRRQIIVVKHAVELEDIRTRHVFPHDHLLTKTLFLTQLARVHALSFLDSPSPLTFLRTAGGSSFEVLKTFTATGSPFWVPR